MRLTVLVCTHDRAELALAAVESALAQSLDEAHSLEVLVVDNASTEASSRALSSGLPADPRVRLVQEPTLGLSAARNTGLAEADGDVVAFLDDDAVAHAGWLQALAAAFDEPGLTAVAGRIHLRWLGHRPHWLRPGAALERHLSGLDLGDSRSTLQDETPYGANMAVRRADARAVGGFDVSLGRVGGRLLSMEEVAFFLRLRARGARVDYLPEAAVDHLVPRERGRVGFFVRRSYWQGRSEVAAGPLLGRPAPTGVRWAVRRLAGSTVAMARRRESPVALVVGLSCEVAYVLGVLRG